MIRISNRGGPAPTRRGPARDTPAPGPSRRRRAVGLARGLALALSLSLAAPAGAQYPRDAAARDEIARIVREQYAQQRYDRAEASLLGVIVSCKDECSPALLARAWMYVGIVRGDGLADQAAARQAFDNAVAQDRGVQLDAPLASRETSASFEAARGATLERGKTGPLIGAPSGAPAPRREDPSQRAAPAEAVRQGLTCTPSEREIQTRRPIPFDCRGDAEAERITLRYREHPEAPWQTLELEPSDGSFRATLPCELTMNSGRLEYFIVSTDDAGDPVDTLGSKSAPIELVLNPNSDVAPAFPGEPPPERCAEQVLCPPEFPGCDDPDAPLPGGARPRARSEHWLTFDLAADVGFVGGSNVCTASNADYDCFASGSDTPFPGALPEAVAFAPGELGDAYPGTRLSTAPALGTLRVLLGYERAVSERVSLGGRLGYAFGGAPKTLEGEGFLPIHAEVRLGYWPSGLSSAGLRPYLSFGGGVAEVDLKKSDLAVRDCSEEPTRSAFLDCIVAAGAYAPGSAPDLPERRLDAYRKLGDAFVTAGGGLLVPVGERTSLRVGLQALLMLPSVGLVLQPSLGLVYGL